MNDLHHTNPNERASARSFFTELATNRTMGAFFRGVTYTLIWMPALLVYFASADLLSEAVTVGTLQAVLGPVLAFGIIVGFAAAIGHSFMTYSREDSR